MKRIIMITIVTIVLFGVGFNITKSFRDQKMNERHTDIEVEFKHSSLDTREYVYIVHEVTKDGLGNVVETHSYSVDDEEGEKLWEETH